MKTTMRLFAALGASALLGTTGHAAVLLSYDFGTLATPTLAPTGGVSVKQYGHLPSPQQVDTGGAAGERPSATLSTNTNPSTTSTPTGTAQGYDAAVASQIVVGGTGDTGYVQFVLTTPVGGIDLQNISVGFASGGNLTTTGAVRGSQVRYSFDGFTTNMLAGTTTLNSSNSSTSGVLVNNGPFTLNDQFPTGGIGGTGLTTSNVTFRFYGFATTTSGTTNSPNQTGAVRFDNVIVNGSVIPEPSTALLGALGVLATASPPSRLI